MRLTNKEQVDQYIKQYKDLNSRKSFKTMNLEEANDCASNIFRLNAELAITGAVSPSKYSEVLKEALPYTYSSKVFSEVMNDEGDTPLTEKLPAACVISFLAAQLELLTLRKKVKEYIDEADYWKDLLDNVCAEEMKSYKEKNPE